MNQTTAFEKTSYGVGSRLKSPPTPEMRAFFQHIYLDHVDAAAFEASVEINIAHVLMLREESIIDRDVAAALLRELLGIRQRGFAAFRFDVGIGDSLPNLENHVIEAIGDRVGGMLHIGRSRGDYYSTLSRMKYRRHLLQLMHDMLDFRQVLISLVQAHTESIMPGYTHLQHAQPITLGYYLCAYVHELERDFARAIDAYERLNLSPLGLGIISSTSYPLNRQRTAGLLGFRALLRNGRDLTDRDYAVETAAVGTNTMLHLHKLATDLYEWATSEFSMVRVDDGDAMTSSMMPQKANPVLLEEVRTKTAMVVGDLMSLVTMVKGSPANNIEQTSGDIPALEAIDRTADALQGFSAFLPRIRFDLVRMERLVAMHWSQATDLADTLVESTPLSFREAHRVVGALVARSIDEGMTPQQVTIENLEDAARSVLQSDVDLRSIDLGAALDPRRALERRVVEGGPAPILVRAAAAEAAKQFGTDAAALANREQDLLRAREGLLGDAGRLLEG
jgi:argininosuccinate lyase